MGVIAVLFWIARAWGHARLKQLLFGLLLAAGLGTASHANPFEEQLWFGGVQAYPITEYPAWTISQVDQGELFERLDISGEPSFGLQVRLPRPLEFSRSFTDGAWRVDGVGVRAAPDVEIRATGSINSSTEQMQGDLTLRFLF